MKSRELNILRENFDIDYDDSLDENLIQECLEEEFDVPSECIESLNIYDEHIHIKLASDKRYFNDDWYVNLQRVG